MAGQHLQRQHAQKIYAVLSHDEPEIDLPLADLILTSWRRCATNDALDPLRTRKPDVIESTALRELHERFQGFLRLAEPEIINLHSSLSGSGFALILTNNQGVILHHLTSDNMQSQFREAGLWLGADWGESQVGTNGIGTCIAEDRPLTVHKDEHFLTQNIHLTCSAAPIHDPHGNLLAVLDISGCSNQDSNAAQVLARALVANSSRSIENQFFLHELRNQRVLRFTQNGQQTGLSSEGMMAIDEQNRILAANRGALDLLGLDDRQNLLGQELNYVLDQDLDTLMLYADKGDHRMHALRDQRSGDQFFGYLHNHKETPKRRGNGLSIKPSKLTQEECRGELCSLSALAGDDPRMQEAARRAQRVMNKSIPILLQGETGTGKELFTHAIHRASERKDKPFVALNCASIPESLIESELFGYRQGAFTGARKEGRRGKFIESDGGTLFLDEIGDMPLTMQSRLLRVLETQEVVPLGGDKVVTIDLHIVTATHRDLRQLVREGSFREDLYYRLNGITLALPPLRERQDLNEIIHKVLEAENDTSSELKIAKDAMDALLDYQWPGNLRQLRYVVRTAIALCENGVLQIDDFDIEHDISPSADGRVLSREPDDLFDAKDDDLEEDEDNPLQEAERQVILSSLSTNGWNITRTAQALDMSRNTLYRKMKKHGIDQTR